MTSYRRGFTNKVWDKYWHWQPKCDAYPTSNCIMQKNRPSEELLCGRCRELSDDKD